MNDLLRSEKIYRILSEATQRFSPASPKKVIESVYINALSKATGISPNNISMELNRLFLDGRVMRVRGRPVIYFTCEDIERTLKKKLPTHEFPGLDSFMEFVQPHTYREKSKTGVVLPSLNASAASDFDYLIGSAKSLRVHIESAKAGILYPPHGLNTLITGQTGVGKSHFANAMYDFAKKSNRLSPSASMVTFNCANYAENPQLLTSQLFGYAKGAFTGADSDKPGLVESADKGLLFLDEIHRLNHEGQEKLFLLMDKGIFRRLGETTKTRHADVLIVGATTEPPQSSMLSTFLRRIPLHIELPPLSERSIYERLQLVLFFFWKEALNLQKKMVIDRKIIVTFVHYNCPSNIGQLATDIQLTCANAYYKHLVEQTDSLHIEFDNVNRDVALSLFTIGGNSRILDTVLKDSPIVIERNVTSNDLLSMYII